MTPKNKVEVRIAGKSYTLIGVESDEYMQRVGLYIDKKINEIIRVNNMLSTSMSAVLTAINVADDYFKAHENEILLKKELDNLNDAYAKLKEEKRSLADENAILSKSNTSLQLELAKREAELNEVRNSIGKTKYNGI